MKTNAGKLYVAGDRLVDALGRQVILHGVNMVCKDRTRGYVGNWTREDFRYLRSLGMNTIRLGILWAGLEPAPGQVDEGYLDRIESLVRMADEAGLYVFLDMHQDLYAETFADGAPAWATLCGDIPHDASGAVWSDAYLNSRAVQVAFDRFWENAPAEDGVGLQDHYAAVWRRVAGRFSGYTCVVGYDLMNEPFPGSMAVEVEGAMIQAFLRLQREMDGAGEWGTPDVAGAGSTMAGMDAPSVEGSAAEAQLAAIWMSPEGRAHILSLLTDADVYEAISGEMEPVVQQFDRTVLSPFYQRVADAIRQVDAKTLLFLEASYFSNMGVRSGVLPVQYGGSRDPQQLYAPHGYDLTVDTTMKALWSPVRVDVIFRHHAEVATLHHWPMLVGEWGAFWENAAGEGCGDKAQADQLRVIFERTRCGDTFWCYPDDGIGKQNLDGFGYSDAIVRGVPLAVNGSLASYCWSPGEKTLELVWVEGDGMAETVLWVPGRVGRVVEKLRNAVERSPVHHQEVCGKGTRLSFPPGPAGETRTMLIRHD